MLSYIIVMCPIISKSISYICHTVYKYTVKLFKNKLYTVPGGNAQLKYRITHQYFQQPRMQSKDWTNQNTEHFPKVQVERNFPKI